MTASEPRCPVCDGTPRVLLVIQHPAMLRLTRELLEREFGCWVATEARAGPGLAGLLHSYRPDIDVVVVDEAEFPACCLDTLDGFPPSRVVVIGPEPDASYRAAALRNGAGAWLPRERVGDDLGREMRRILGCVHDPCPPGEHGARRAGGDNGSARRPRRRSTADAE